MVERVYREQTRRTVMTLGVCLFVRSLLSSELPVVELRQQSASLRLAVVGDTGLGADVVANGIRILNQRAPIDAIVLTGDAFYPCGPVSASDPVWSRAKALEKIGVPLLPVLGNHDFCSGSRPDAQIGPNALDHWIFPARQYVVSTPSATLVMLDTTPAVTGQPQEAESAIRSLQGSRDHRWRIVAGHHPLLSSGWHGHFPRAEHRRMVALIPMMKAAGVDLYLCGHDHHLELIDARPRMLISGSGSDPIPPLLAHRATLFPHDAVAFRGFAVIELTDRELVIQFFDAGGQARSRLFRLAR